MRKLAPVRLLEREDVMNVLARALEVRCDELLGLGHIARMLTDEGEAKFPIDASFPEPPDIVLEWPGGELAVEVTRLT